MRRFGRIQRDHPLRFGKPLVRSVFFIPAFLLLLLLVVYPVVQTVYLGFVFHPSVTVTLGENSGDSHRGVTEDVGVTEADPDRNFDRGNPGERFPIGERSFLWLRFNLSVVPNVGRVTAVRLVLYSAEHDVSGNPSNLVVAGANGRSPGTSWVQGLASWNTFDGAAPWSGGADGGAGDRGPDFRILALDPEAHDGYLPFRFNPSGVSYTNAGIGGMISLQVYASTEGHRREFSFSEGADGRRPHLEVTYERPEEVVGLDNYGEVLADPDTLNPSGVAQGEPPFGTFINNLLWIAIHLPASLFLGMFLALTLQKVRGAAVVKSMIFVGMVTPMIVGGIILRFLFESPVGIVPAFFDTVGVQGLSRSWLTSSPGTLLFGLIIGSVWLWTGFSMIVYSAGLTTIPPDYFEAARIDGASDWRIFWKITWPLLRPMTLVVITMTILWELKLFDIVIAATNAEGGLGGSADVLALQMFRYAFVAVPPRFNDAAVVATLLTLLTLVASAWLFRRMLLGPSRKPWLRMTIGKLLRPIRQATGR